MKNNEFEVTAEIKIKLTEEDIDDIMCSFLEGGVTALWFDEVDPCGDLLGEYASEQISRGGELWFHDREEDAWYKLTRKKFFEGFKRWVESGGDIYDAVTGGKVDTCNIDAICADAIIQYALFGDVIYG